MTLIFCGVDSVSRWSNGEALKQPQLQFMTWGGVVGPSGGKALDVLSPCSAFGSSGPWRR